MPDPIPMEPKPRLRPKLIRTNLYCPACLQAGYKQVMRRQGGLNGRTMKITERRCICPRCGKSFTRTLNRLTKVSTFVEIKNADPIPEVIFSRERKKEMLVAKRIADYETRRD